MYSILQVSIQFVGMRARIKYRFIYNIIIFIIL